MNLDIGCGINKHGGFVGMDARPLDGVDIVHDIQDFPWPIDDNSCECVLMRNIYEHIEPKYRLQMMDEVWRVMKPNGRLLISSPYAGSVRAFQDPTHYTCPNEVTFLYFAPKYPYYYLVYSPKPWLLIVNTWEVTGNVDAELGAIK